MDLLFVTHYFPPEVGAPQTRLYELGRRLAARGHRVTVLTGFPNYPTGVIPAPYRGKFFQREMMAGMNVVRAWMYAAPQQGFTRRLLNHLSLTLTSIPASAAAGHADVLFVESPPLLLGLAGYVISRLKRAPYVFNVADLWPETAVALGALTNPLAIRLAEWLARFIYRHAARVTTVTDGIRRLLVEQGLPDSQVILLTNGVDTSCFHPDVDPEPAVKALGLDGRLTVAYAGTHGLAQGLEALIEAAHLLRHDGHLRFILVGEGAEKSKLVGKVADHELENVSFFPNQPKSLMPHLWAAVDIGVVCLRRLEIFRSALPSKLFEIMAAGRPVVLAAEGEARDLVLGAEAGLVVSPEDGADLAQAIQQLAADPEARRRYGENARRYVQAHFDREHLTDLLEATFNDIEEKHHARAG